MSLVGELKEFDKGLEFVRYWAKAVIRVPWVVGIGALFRAFGLLPTPE